MRHRPGTVGDSGRLPTEPGWCEGYEILDPLGRRIGRAEKLFVNGDGYPEYVRVRLGFFGSRSVLIPVQDVGVDDERRALILR